MCAHCAGNITKAVSAMNGVNSVTVDIDTKTVFAEFDENQTSESAIREKMAEIGYIPD
jgi:copper chaperone